MQFKKQYETYCIKRVKFKQKHKGGICKGSHISVLIYAV